MHKRLSLFFFVILLLTSCANKKTITLKIDNVTFNFKFLEKDKYLLDSEVTNKQFQQYLNENNISKNDSNKINKYGKQNFRMDYICKNIFNIWVNEITLEDYFKNEKGDLPVTFISQDEARAFIDWFNKKFTQTYYFRLPTSDEMYFASFNNGNRNFPWGNSFNINYFANKLSSERFNGKSINTLQEISIAIGRKLEPVYHRNGKSPNGIFGIWGNASEWLYTDCDYLESDVYSECFVPKFNTICNSKPIKGSDSIGFRMILVRR